MDLGLQKVSRPIWTWIMNHSNPAPITKNTGNVLNAPSRLNQDADIERGFTHALKTSISYYVIAHTHTTTQKHRILDQTVSMMLLFSSGAVIVCS